jgi:hypothetical protein
MFMRSIEQNVTSRGTTTMGTRILLCLRDHSTISVVCMEEDEEIIYQWIHHIPQG